MQPLEVSPLAREVNDAGKRAAAKHGRTGTAHPTAGMKMPAIKQPANRQQKSLLANRRFLMFSIAFMSILLTILLYFVFSIWSGMRQREKERSDCTLALKEMHVGEGIDKEHCLARKASFKAGFSCKAMCQRGYTEMLTMTDNKMTCTKDGTWADAPEVGPKDLKAKATFCKKKPAPGDCLYLATDAGSELEKDRRFYWQFVQAGEEDQWNIKRQAILDFQTRSAPSESLKHCECAPVADTCSLEFDMGKPDGGLEVCDELADLADHKWQNDWTIKGVELRQHSSRSIFLAQEDYDNQWWCEDDAGKRTPCILPMSQKKSAEASYSKNGAKAETVIISVLTIQRANQELKVEYLNVCQILRQKDGKSDGSAKNVHIVHQDGKVATA